MPIDAENRFTSAHGEVHLAYDTLFPRPSLATQVGVVGRTGAGKSSLAQALLRMVEPYPGGCMRIDGIDTSQLLVQSLRSKISVIPQDPVLFSGTIRFGGRVCVCVCVCVVCVECDSLDGSVV